MEDKILEIIKEESENANVRKYTCVNGFGYSQFERNIADRVVKLFCQPVVRRSISLWVEGFAVTGERQGASMIGTYEATDLDDAVKQYMETHKGDVDWDRFGRGRHAIWACEIFDNEGEARKSFG